MNKLYIGARVRMTHLNYSLGSKEATVIAYSITGKWETDNGYFINEDGKTISGTKGIIATVELLNPIKRYKYKYKRK